MTSLTKNEFATSLTFNIIFDLPLYLPIGLFFSGVRIKFCIHFYLLFVLYALPIRPSLILFDITTDTKRSVQNIILWTDYFDKIYSRIGSRYSTGLDGQGSIPGSAIFLLFFTASRPALGPTQPPVQWVLGAISPGVKRTGRETDHPPTSTAEFKNGGDVPPLPHMSSWSQYSPILSVGP
jgi:hypothetical protein